MKLYYILCLSLFALLLSCGGDAVSDTNSPDTGADAPEESITTYLREPVEIVASTGEDYPKSLIDIDFPILPNTEVTSVGNTEIENGTVVMQMETVKTINQIKSYYDKEMRANGWELKEMKVFQGADAAFSYRSPEYSARVLVINDKVQDFRKIAVTLNKRIKLEDY